uniref:Uncharacterized protein n=1 Tax=Romanomermis culicivorax TaxID=13658 RepID=A0A915IFF5_ROMCU
MWSDLKAVTMRLNLRSISEISDKDRTLLERRAKVWTYKEYISKFIRQRKSAKTSFYLPVDQMLFCITNNLQLNL